MSSFLAPAQTAVSGFVLPWSTVKLDLVES